MPLDKEKFEKCVSEDEYFTAKYVFVGLGKVFARILIRTPITPNQLTIFWGALMVVCSLAFVLHDYYISILAGIGWVVAYALDETDGMIARYKNMRSQRGKYYDMVNHRVTYPLMMFCIGFGVYRSGRDVLLGMPVNPLWFVILGFLAGLGMIIIMDLGECYNKSYPEGAVDNDKGSRAVEGKNFDQKKYLLLMNLNPLTFTNMLCLIPIFALLNLMHIFILFYGVMYVLGAVARYVVLARAIPPRLE